LIKNITILLQLKKILKELKRVYKLIVQILRKKLKQ